MNSPVATIGIGAATTADRRGERRNSRGKDARDRRGRHKTIDVDVNVI